MNTFNHGDVIEYEAVGGWCKGIYVGPHPVNHDVHIFVSDKGFVYECISIEIRKPKQKKEGWMNVWPRCANSIGIHIASGTLIYATKEEALSANRPNRQKEVLATVKVEWEE